MKNLSSFFNSNLSSPLAVSLNLTIPFLGRYERLILFFLIFFSQLEIINASLDSGIPKTETVL